MRERERLQENISFQYAWNNFRIISILSEELGIWFAKEGMLERGENMHKMGLKRVVSLAKMFAFKNFFLNEISPKKTRRCRQDFYISPLIIF